MALSLSRNATFIGTYVTSGTVWDGSGTVPGSTTAAEVSDTFEIAILDGFSFSQATGTQNVTLNEAGASPRRGQNIFNTSLEPVDWSFTTYVRPKIDNLSTDLHGMAEKILWNALVSSIRTDNVGTGGITSTAAACTVDFGESNKNQLLKFDGFFKFSDSGFIYNLTDMCVNSASIDFDIDGIAQITWSGYASSIATVAEANAPTTAASATDGYTAMQSTCDFILNRLSTVTLTSSISGGSKAYHFPLTGGNITIDNGISYVTPEELGKINTPINHQVGTRAVSGNFTCYLDTAAGNLGSKDIYDDMLTDINGAAPDITKSFDIELKIGGAAAPKVTFNLNQAHLELPSIDTADVMGATINFTALESAFGTGNNEAEIVYTGLTVV
jgi:hypothetical protein